MLKKVFDRGGEPPADECVVVVIGEHSYRISRCAYVASGLRCGFPGTISHSTMNRGPKNDEPEARWFCRYHFDCQDHKRGALIVEKSHEPRPPPEEQPPGSLPLRSGNLAWARRILDRHEAGERMPSYSVQLARAALGVREDDKHNTGEGGQTNGSQ